MNPRVAYAKPSIVPGCITSSVSRMSQQTIGRSFGTNTPHASMRSSRRNWGSDMRSSRPVAPERCASVRLRMRSAQKTLLSWPPTSGSPRRCRSFVLEPGPSFWPSPRETVHRHKPGRSDCCPTMAVAPACLSSNRFDDASEACEHRRTCHRQDRAQLSTPPKPGLI